MRTLVLYATEEGQTEKIAHRILDGLAQHNIPSDLHNIADESVTPALDAYDAVVIGSPMHFSHYDSQLADYLTEYQSVLNEIPSAFFSVSLGILSDEKSERAEIEQITEKYLIDVGWRPEIKRHFGGALAYSKYGWFKRQMMYWIAKRGGAKTDTRYDYEFTDWPQVDEFVDEFVAFTESCKEPEDARVRRSIYAEPSRPYSVKYRKATASS